MSSESGRYAVRWSDRHDLVLAHALARLEDPVARDASAGWKRPLVERRAGRSRAASARRDEAQPSVAVFVRDHERSVGEQRALADQTAAIAGHYAVGAQVDDPHRIPAPTQPEVIAGEVQVFATAGVGRRAPALVATERRDPDAAGATRSQPERDAATGDTHAGQPGLSCVKAIAAPQPPRTARAQNGDLTAVGA